MPIQNGKHDNAWLIGSNLFEYDPCMSTKGTILVVLKNRDEVILAADSLVTVTQEGSTTTYRQECKIQQVEDAAFAIAGLHKCHLTRFDAYAIARSALLQSGRIDKAMRTFRKQVRKPLYRALAAVKDQTPEDYVRDHENQEALTAVFVGFERGTPILGVTNSFLMSQDSGAVLRSNYIYRETGTHSLVFGHCDQVLGKTPPKNLGDDPVSLALGLIQLQIDADARNDIRQIDWPVWTVRINAESAKSSIGIDRHDSLHS